MNILNPYPWIHELPPSHFPTTQTKIHKQQKKTTPRYFLGFFATQEAVQNDGKVVESSLVVFHAPPVKGDCWLLNSRSGPQEVCPKILFGHLGVS